MLHDRGALLYAPDRALYEGLTIEPRVDAAALEHDVLAETCRAAAARGLAVVLGIDREVGSLRVGSCADVALFRLPTGTFPLYDIFGEMREANRLLVNALTIVDGRALEPLAPEPPAPWAEDPIWPDLQKEFADRLHAMREYGHTPAAMRAAAEADATARDRGQPPASGPPTARSPRPSRSSRG